MGIVYLVQTGMGLGALKLIRPQLADDPEFQARFRQEVEAGRAVSGPYTARFIDAELGGLTPYLVTEYVDGPSLAQAVADGGPFDFGATVGLAQALRSIHAVGVTHRDLKPSNVLLGATGPRIFRLWHRPNGGQRPHSDWDERWLSPVMAPEAARGGTISPATDVFAWACVVTFAGTGRPPFGEGRPEADLYRIVHEQPDLIGLDARLVEVVQAALSRDPAARPSTAQLVEGVSRSADGATADPAAISTAVIARSGRLLHEGRPDRTARLDPADRRRRWPITAAVIVVLAAIGTVALAPSGLPGSNAHRPAAVTTSTTGRTSSTTVSATSATTTSTVESTSSSTTTSSTAGAGTMLVDLPLVICPTDDAVSLPSVALPRAMAETVPSDLVGQLDVFTDNAGTMKLVGPKGWLCKAAVGSDGQSVVDIYPEYDSAPDGFAFQ